MEKISFLYKFFPNKLDCTNSYPARLTPLRLPGYSMPHRVRPNFGIPGNTDMNRTCGELHSGATESRLGHSSMITISNTRVNQRPDVTELK